MAARPSPNDREITSSVLEVPVPEPKIQPEEGRIDIRDLACHTTISAIRNIVPRFSDPESPIRLSNSDRKTLEGEVGKDLRILARQAFIANNAERALADLRPQPSQHSSRREAGRARAQTGAVAKAYRTLMTLPATAAAPDTRPISEEISDGLLTVGPPGIGKTVIAARVLRAIGIGRQVNAKDPEPIRATLVIPELALINQALGEVGDDTLQRFLGEGVTVTEWSGRQRNPEGHLMAVTKQSLPDAIEKEVAGHGARDVTVFDEAHHALGAQTFEILPELGKLLFFTATSGYNLDRDLRNYFPTIELGTLRSFVEEGVLNPVRLLTFQAEKAELPAIAAGLASSFIRQGRRVVCYAEPGSQSAQAKNIVSMVNAKLGYEAMAAIGTFPGNNSTHDLQRFERKQIDGLATVGMLREGYNHGEIDVIMTVGRSYSLLDLTQKDGRGLRPGRFETIIAEVLPPPRPGRPLITHWHVFGLEDVQQGAYIGPDPDRLDSERGNDLDLKDLPEYVLEALVPNKPLREITIAPEDLARKEAPAGYVCGSELAKELEVPEEWLYMKLDAAKLHYVGIWPVSTTDEYERWYEPKVHEYLQENPIPKLAAESEMTVADLMGFTGAERQLLKQTIDDLQIKPTERLGRKTHRPTGHYSFAEALRIKAAIDQIPIAELSDVVYAHLANELGHSTVATICADLGITPSYYRRNPAYGIKGFTRHLSATEARLIRQERAKILSSADGYTRIADIAAMAGVSETTLKSSLTEFEKNNVALVRIVGARAHNVSHLPDDLVPALVERVRAKPLPRTLVPLEVFEARCTKFKHRANISQWLHKNGFQPDKRRIAGLSDSKLSCYTWDALKAFEAAYPPPDSVAYIDFDEVVRAPDDTDPKRNAYAKAILERYLPGTQIAPPPLSWQPPRAKPPRPVKGTPTVRAVVDPRDLVPKDPIIDGPPVMETQSKPTHEPKAVARPPAPEPSDGWWDPDVWMERAACRKAEDPDIFYPPVGQKSEHHPEVKEALRICGRCPVKTECGTYTFAVGDTEAIAGGKTPYQITQSIRGNPAKRASLRNTAKQQGFPLPNFAIIKKEENPTEE